MIEDLYVLPSHKTVCPYDESKLYRKKTEIDYLMSDDFCITNAYVCKECGKKYIVDEYAVILGKIAEEKEGLMATLYYLGKKNSGFGIELLWDINKEKNENKGNKQNKKKKMNSNEEKEQVSQASKKKIPYTCNQRIYVTPDNKEGICCFDHISTYKKEVCLSDRKGNKKLFSIDTCDICNRFFTTNKFYNEYAHDFNNIEFVISDKDSNYIKKDGHINEVKNRALSAYDYVIRSNTFYCTDKNHSIENVECEVEVIKMDGSRSLEQIPAAYCIECNVYYILENDYIRVKQIGVLICKILTIELWRKSSNTPYHMQQESLLHMMGYNVNAQSNLSDYQRQKILEVIIDNKFLSRIEICSHLDYLINRSRQRINFDEAVSKWRSDREYIINYIRSGRVTQPKTITENKYITKR